MKIKDSIRKSKELTKEKIENKIKWNVREGQERDDNERKKNERSEIH